MKRIILSVVALISLATVSMAQEPAAPKADNPNQAEFKFEKEVHDFGTVKEGTMAEYTFKFTNTGKEPLVVSNVVASCGCTTPKWSKEPIRPGESGSVTAIYNSKGRPGAFNKAITITSNAKTSTKVLFIKGNVDPSDTSSDNATPVKKEGPSGPTESKPR